VLWDVRGFPGRRRRLQRVEQFGRLDVRRLGLRELFRLELGKWEWLELRLSERL
jgi:hypothetical protein